MRQFRLNYLKKVSMLVEQDKAYWIDFLCEIEPLKTAIDEVEKTIRILANYDKEYASICNREPVGIYRVSLPFNNPIYSFVLYSCGIAFAGNEVIVRPSKYTAQYVKTFYAAYSQFSEIGIILFLDSGEKFISDAYEETRPGGLLFTGAYEHLIDIKSKFPSIQHLIYCGSGINPIILGEGISDLNIAVDSVINSRIYNSGQDCLCSEKIVVHESIYDDFLSILIKKLSQLKLGKPGDKSADIYPPFLAIKDDILNRYFLINKKEKCMYKRIENDCILAVYEVGIDSESLNSEKFCPIFTLAKFEDEKDLYPIISSEYKFGLIALGNIGLNVVQHFPHVATSGTVMQLEALDAHVPFGGKGKSGFSILGNKYKDGPILFSYETTRKK